jgi:hypothetical protein
VHRQVLEGVGLAALDRIVARDCRLDVGQRVVVLGMLGDPVGGDRVHRGQDFASALLAQGFTEKAAHVVRGRGEHGAARLQGQAPL